MASPSPGPCWWPPVWLTPCWRPPRGEDSTVHCNVLFLSPGWPSILESHLERWEYSVILYIMHTRHTSCRFFEKNSHTLVIKYELSSKMSTILEHFCSKTNWSTVPYLPFCSAYVASTAWAPPTWALLSSAGWSPPAYVWATRCWHYFHGKPFLVFSFMSWTHSPGVWTLCWPCLEQQTLLVRTSLS